LDSDSIPGDFVRNDQFNPKYLGTGFAFTLYQTRLMLQASISFEEHFRELKVLI
jgi:hypothetical protein